MDSISQRMVGVVLTALLIAGCSNDAGIEGSSKEVTDTSKSAPRQGSGQATQSAPAKEARIILLHHSTGQCIWEGGVKSWFDAYNVANGTKYSIIEKEFPKGEPYGWNNYPYDYTSVQTFPRFLRVITCC